MSNFGRPSVVGSTTEVLMEAPKGFGLQVSLALSGCLRRKACKLKVHWHLVLVKEVLLLFISCTSGLPK